MRLLQLYAYIIFLGTLCLPGTRAILPNRLSDLFDAHWQNQVASYSGLQWPPPDFDFWKEAEKLGKKAEGLGKKAEELGKKAIEYADRNFAESALKFPSVVDRIAEFKASVQDLIRSAEALRIRPTQGLVAWTNLNIDFDELYRKLNEEIDIILEQLKAEFSEPLPEDRSDASEKREEVVDRTLDKLESALIKVFGLWDIPATEVRERFSQVIPQIRGMVLLAGDLADRHPVLVGVLLESAWMMIPQGFILRPLLRVFGFGPVGIIKGSGAAWAQRFFFREAIAGGSWFARLQSAGTKCPP